MWLFGSRGNLFTATCTDDVRTELLDPNSLNLYKSPLLGQRISGYGGNYAGGGAIFRIYNLRSKKIKTIGALNVDTEEEYHKLDRPIVIEKNDIIQVLCVAAPT